jgi:hypothetical protein
MALLVSTLALAPAHAQSTGTTVSVIRVVDGDTVDVAFDDGRVERLRLIGIDTPEVVDPRKPVQCFGREASAHANELLDGQTVSLELDPTQDDRDIYDSPDGFAQAPGDLLVLARAAPDAPGPAVGQGGLECPPAHARHEQEVAEAEHTAARQPVRLADHVRQPGQPRVRGD